MDNKTKIIAVLESNFPNVKEECIERIAEHILNVLDYNEVTLPAIVTEPDVTLLPWVPSTAATPKPCQGCPNHPSNGGSGVCHCTLGIGAIT